jgi:signal transduction histidine kinase
MSSDITERKQAEEELTRSRRRLQRFSEHLENVLDEERKRISREIHDELGQMLTVLKFDLSWFKLQSKSKRKEVSDKMKEMEETVVNALASVKRISKELRPPQLDALGLVGAIQLDVNQIEKKARLHAHVRIEPPEFVLDKNLSMTIYRVFNEILTNVVRHAHAKKVDILLMKGSNSVDLRVRDDGRGITTKELDGDGSLGLVGMRERVRQWNGTLSIEGRHGKGTSVSVHFPLKRTTLEG